jgi:hypothetical protein
MTTQAIITIDVASWSDVLILLFQMREAQRKEPCL